MHLCRPEDVLADPVRTFTDSRAIHVWPLLLAGSEEARAQCAALLSEQELERARRFHSEEHRRNFIFAHGITRRVLGAYRGIAPRDLEFTTNEFGKPAIAGLSFNLSHSHERALLAVSLQRDVGVDIEHERGSTNVLGIASSYFFGPEFEAIRDAPGEQQITTFFRFWVAKEAVLKAQGTGLHVALDSFHVCFEPGQQAARVETMNASRIASGWVVRYLEIGGGWHAAVAALSDDWRVEVIE